MDPNEGETIHYERVNSDFLRRDNKRRRGKKSKGVDEETDRVME